MAVLVLVALVGGTVYAARLYLFPFRNCRHCGGTGRQPSRLNHDLCKHCAGNGHVLRPGARLIHRTVLTAQSPTARSRLWQRERQAVERSAPPLPAAARRELPGRELP